MARPKKNVEVVDKVEKNDSLANLQNSFSEFMKKDDSIIIHDDENLMCVPTGIDLLDQILGGGFYTKINVIAGPAGGGKSALCTSVLKSGQKKWGNEFIGIYLDSEESMTTERLVQLGVKNKVDIVSGMTIEKVFKIIEKLCAFKIQNPQTLKIPSVIVWDSIANTKSESEIEASELQNTMGARRAMLLAHYLPQYAQKLAKCNIVLLAVNQYRDDIDMSGNPYQKKKKDLKFLRQGISIPGGKSLYYNCFTLLELSQGKLLQDSKKDNILGFDAIEVGIYAIKNKKFTPNIPINVVFNFSKGFLNFWTNFNMLKEYKYVTTGAWCKLNSYPTVQFRQKECLSYYKKDIEFRKMFDIAVKDCLKQQFEDKYKDVKQSLDFDDEDDIIISDIGTDIDNDEDVNDVVEESSVVEFNINDVDYEELDVE